MTHTARAVRCLLHPQDAEGRGHAVFLGQAADPESEQYLIQVRTVRNGLLRAAFLVVVAAGDPAWLRQGRTVPELLGAFVLHQQAMWGTDFSDPRADRDGGRSRVRESGAGVRRDGRVAGGVPHLEPGGLRREMIVSASRALFLPRAPAPTLCLPRWSRVH
jgi:hypothetical protein